MADKEDDEIFKAIRVSNPYEGMSEAEILIEKGIAANESEANEVILGAPPIIEGFSNSSDIQIDDTKIRKILGNNFPPEIMKFVKIGRITKNDKYNIYFPKQLSRDNVPDYVYWNEYSIVGIEPDKLDDFYNWVNSQINLPRDEFYRKNLLFSSVPLYDTIVKINLYNLGFKLDAQKSYFKDMPFFDQTLRDEDNLKMYIIGLLSHEFTHRLQQNMPEVKELVSNWKTMISKSPKPFISLYAQWYADGTYAKNIDIAVEEDMADSVMIYLINPNYLPFYKYSLLKEYMPWLNAGSAIEILS